MKWFRFISLSLSILVGCGLLFGNGISAHNSDAPALTPTYDIPFEVPGKANDHNPPEFYLFSWQEFFALNWPAMVPAGRPPLRGVPDTDKTIGDSGPRVWETWKSDFELFPAQPGYPGKIIQPTSWNSWDQPEPVCGAEHLAAGEKLLPLLAKGESVIPGGVNQAMGGPFVDQHLQYVRYEIRVNETEYNETKDRQWFLRKNLSIYPKPRNEFSSSHPGHYGPIEIKASWRILTDEEANATPPRFYMSKAWVSIQNIPVTVLRLLQVWSDSISRIKLSNFLPGSGQHSSMWITSPGTANHRRRRAIHSTIPKRRSRRNGDFA